MPTKKMLKVTRQKAAYIIQKKFIGVPWDDWDEAPTASMALTKLKTTYSDDNTFRVIKRVTEETVLYKGAKNYQGQG